MLKKFMAILKTGTFRKPWKVGTLVVRKRVFAWNGSKIIFSPFTEELRLNRFFPGAKPKIQIPPFDEISTWV